MKHDNKIQFKTIRDFFLTQGKIIPNEKKSKLKMYQASMGDSIYFMEEYIDEVYANETVYGVSLYRFNGLGNDFFYFMNNPEWFKLHGDHEGGIFNVSYKDDSLRQFIEDHEYQLRYTENKSFDDE
jgi:hypothetical protein